MREFELLRHVYAANSALDERIAIPPGDDLAMVRAGAGDILLGVDQLVDGVHVDLARTPLSLVGRKAVTRCLSDVAAMAARPVATLVAVTLPPGFGHDRANELFDAMRGAAAQFCAPLVGGDIAFHRADEHPLTCSVTVLATPGAHAPVQRGGAKVGDNLYVTGRLGGSVEPDDGGGRHLTFTPRIDEAAALHEFLGPSLHAMIDISDGLGRDASHIAEQSGVTIEIDAQSIPCHAELGWRRAASDGEDYELLFAADREPPSAICGTPVTRIGRVVECCQSTPSVVFIDGDHRFEGDQLGWEHQAATTG